MTESWVWNQVLEKLYTFKYLDRMISFYDSDWPVVDCNLERYQSKWFLSMVLVYFFMIGCLH